jgi:hypothetical protein
VAWPTRDKANRPSQQLAGQDNGFWAWQQGRVGCGMRIRHAPVGIRAVFSRTFGKKKWTDTKVYIIIIMGF